MSGENQPNLDFENGDDTGLDRWRNTVQPAVEEEPLELNFKGENDQLTPWRREQAEKILQTARQEGLPIGEKVRVLLQSDLELTGRLELNPDNRHLQIGNVPFQKSEMVSCVREGESGSAVS